MSYQLPEQRNPLERGGTNRLERLHEALKTGYVKLEERFESDFIRQAARLATQIQYYDETNTAIGDWGSFFDPNVPDDKPHKALFLAFLRLFELLHEHGNTLTDRHLDFYYREVLEFSEESAGAASVHLFFDCARTLSTRFLKAGSRLSAGKTESGKELLFELAEELVVNRTRVADFRSLYQESEAFGNRLFVSGADRQLPNAGGEGLPPFGESQVRYVRNGSQYSEEIAPPAYRTLEDAELGFALSSPLFRMEEGARKICLRIESRDLKLPDPDKSLFHFQLSTEEGWFTVPQAQVILSRSFSQAPGNSLKFLEFEVRLTPLDPAIRNYDTTIHERDYRTPYPIFKVIFNPEASSYGFAKWRELRFERMVVSAGATGVRSLIFQNDRSLLDPKKPFRPFGPVPSPGDNFYIGHPEIFRHQLKDLKVDLNWKDLPTGDLSSHYSAYTVGAAPLTNSDFEVQVDFLDEKNWQALSPAESLFEAADARQIQELDLSWNYPVDYQRKRKEEFAEEWGHSVRHGFLRMRLSGPDRPNVRAFGHAVYPELVMKKGSGVGIPMPYTPMLAEVSLSYHTEEIEIGPAEPETLYQLHPFGPKPISAEGIDYQVALFPALPEEGSFFLGLRDLHPPQSLSLLFRFAEGSGDAELSQLDPGISWSYLAGNEWKELSRLRLSKDTTHNLIHTGILRFDLPEDIDTDHQVMPDGMFWLRASIADQAAGIDHLIDVHAQAAEAREIDPDGSLKTLEPGRIRRFYEGGKGIDAVHQKDPSFGGVQAEDRQALLVRSSERLRHKDRAIMIWDYERLVLQQFPDIWKVKCLNHSDLQTERVAGRVVLALVPDLRNHQSKNPFQPRIGMYKRAEVHDFLSGRLSPFINLRVENPLYEPLKLSFNVGFHEGYDEGFYGQKLHDSVQEFLSPWAFDSGKDLVFGGKIHKSTILKFIEDRPYVDFVNDFTLYHTFPQPDIAGEFANLSPVREGAVHTFRFEFTSQNAPFTTTLIRIKVRLLNGLISTNLESKFIDEVQTVLGNKDRKGFQITRSLVNTLLKSIYYVDRIVAIDTYIVLPEDMVMKDVDVAEAKTGRSIMTSDKQHRIGVYRAGDYQCEGNVMIGIGFMIVEADFIVT